MIMAGNCCAIAPRGRNLIAPNARQQVARKVARFAPMTPDDNTTYKMENGKWKIFKCENANRK